MCVCAVWVSRLVFSRLPPSERENVFLEVLNKIKLESQNLL